MELIVLRGHTAKPLASRRGAMNSNGSGATTKTWSLSTGLPDRGTHCWAQGGGQALSTARPSHWTRHDDGQNPSKNRLAAAFRDLSNGHHRIKQLERERGHRIGISGIVAP